MTAHQIETTLARNGWKKIILGWIKNNIFIASTGPLARDPEHRWIMISGGRSSVVIETQEQMNEVMKSINKVKQIGSQYQMIIQ
jgi:hypothetical protein